MRQFPIRFTLLSCLFALLFLPQSMLLSGAEKPAVAVNLKGKSYDIIYPTENGKPKDTIKFEEKMLIIGGLGKIQIPYTATKKGGSTQIEGTLTDEKMGVIEVSGTISKKGELTGSITVRPKKGQPWAKNFNSAVEAK